MINKIEQPLISILMAVYNAEEFLSEAIESVIEQTYMQWELICINDGALDNSLHILQRYQEKHPQIIVIDHPHCGIAACVRNVGLAIANGEYIVMLDSDDKIVPIYLEKLITRQKETQADIVISATAFWDYRNNVISRSLIGVNGDASKVISGRDAFELSLYWEIGALGLLRTDTLKEIKYCEIAINGDEYTSRLLFLHASNVAFCDVIYFYRNNLSSATKKFSFKHFSTIIVDGMILTLIRENKFNSHLLMRYKEKVIVSLLFTYILYVKKRKLLMPEENRLAIDFIWTATTYITKELLVQPYSIKDNLYLCYKLLKRLKNIISTILRHKLFCFFHKV